LEAFAVIRNAFKLTVAANAAYLSRSGLIILTRYEREEEEEEEGI